MLNLKLGKKVVKYRKAISLGIFSNKPKATNDQLKLIGRLDAAYEALEKDLTNYEGFVQTFIQRAAEIRDLSPKPITSWSVLDEVCEKCKVELLILFSLTYSCGYLMLNTGHLRMRGFMRDAQDLAIRLDDFKKGVEFYMAKVLDPMVPIDQENSTGMLGVYYCYEVIQRDFDFSESMKEKYGELDSAMKLHFGFRS
jgi:hypothetical protein